MKKPNFFIVGAPKSATTALSGYLGEHENIFFSNPKEPCFFSTDFPGQREVKSEQEYFSLFQNATDKHIAVGEGSVWYLYSKEAISNIYGFNKNAKIIVMLRNPVDQVYSMHQELYIRRYEVEENFITAWALQYKRRKSGEAPKHCKERKFLQYAEIATYSKQIKRLFEIFPRNQVKIVIFDDFKVNTRKVYISLLDFLEVPDDGRTEFRPSLESRRHKLHWLGSFLINQPPWLIDLKTHLKKAFGIKRLGVRDMVAQYNTVLEKRQPLPPDFIDELKNYFQNDVDRLSEIIGRDLRYWCN